MGATIPDKQTAVDAAALGWSLVELLSRCFLLAPLSQNEQKEYSAPWKGDLLEILPPVRSPRQQLLAITSYIGALANTLGVISCEITLPDDICKDQPCFNVIQHQVEELCKHASDPNKDGQFLTVRGRINQLIIHWDVKIRDEIQQKDPSAYNMYLNAYMVGNSFAALRWYTGLKNIRYVPTESQPQPPRHIFDKPSLDRLSEHVQILAPFLPPFAAISLANSLDYWGRAFLKEPNRFLDDTEVHNQLAHQATIWHDILTGSRDPITYVTPSSIAWRYTLHVILIALPMLLAGLAVAIGITLLLLFLLGLIGPTLAQMYHANTTATTIVTSIGSGLAFLAGIVAAFPILGNLGQWVIDKIKTNADKNTDTVVAQVESSLADMVWQILQQNAINKSTCLPIPVAHKALNNPPLASEATLATAPVTITQTAQDLS